ncbi:MAG: type II toxin-antitoxin system MqsA family antitoxin [Lysobacterales bacterium]|nr:MAG: type II toxin-antitoxin system MqsA family antitoxin [Xanthomonadales bacterium]
MKRPCPVCQLGTLNPGTASVRFERDGMTVVIEAAPALICDTCGEVWFDDAAAERLTDQAEAALRTRERIARGEEGTVSLAELERRLGLEG